MIKKYVVLFFAILCNCNFLFAQQESTNRTLDSLLTLLPNIKVDTARVNTLFLISTNYKGVNQNQGIIYANKALALSKRINWDDGIAISLFALGDNSGSLGDMDAAEKYFKQASLFAKSKLNKCGSYRRLGHLNVLKANYPKALENYFKALKISEDIKNIKEAAIIYSAIGYCYEIIEDYKKALLYLNKSLVINTKLKNKKRVSSNLVIIAGVYKADGKYKSALEYYAKGEKLCQERDDKGALGQIYLSRAEVYMYQGELEKGIEQINKAESIDIDIKNHRFINGCKLTKAEIYISFFSKDSLNPENKILLNKAEPLLIDAIKNYEKANDSYNMTVCYEKLHKLYYFQKNYKKAYTISLKYITLNDSIYSDKSKETIKNIEDQRTIDLKNKQIEIDKITLENKEKQKWFYIAGIGLLCILGGLLFYQSRNRKKINEKLLSLNTDLDQANKTKIRFLSILNHDLRSPVYNFIHFMQLQKESPELLDKETKNEIETKTITSAENLLASMEDILLWSKGQMDNFKPQPKTIAIQSLFDDTKNHFASEAKVSILFDNPESLEINTDENFIKTIIRNLMGNAIKALKQKPEATIIWKAYLSENKTYMSISDNGSGTNQDQLKALYDDTEVVGIKSGLGLHLIRDLAKAIDCDISVESNVGLGTTFLLKF